MLLSRPIICNRKQFGNSFDEFLTIEQKGNKKVNITTYRVENVVFRICFLVFCSFIANSKIQFNLTKQMIWYKFKQDE